MKRTIVIAALVTALFAGTVGTAAAEVRLDFDIPVLLAAGVTLSDITGSGSYSADISNLHIPLPFVDLAWQFGGGTLRGGVGIRSLIALVEFFGWPMGYIEFEPFERLVLRAELGGFAFFALGAYNDFVVNDYTLRVLLPDFQVGYAFTPWFRAGVGTILVVPAGNFDNFGYLFYINARFVLDFK
ncbi:MAG TPA: hypothetical protein VMF68_00785 [Spirochaetia bacterium]|nr:hypothetical protein [Spirochaetia bacterium]HTZ50159.1 hypothetical protein [Spirochaetia bacterium]